jgi:hypothetical protein
MESAAVPVEPAVGAETGEKGLKKDATAHKLLHLSEVPVLVVPLPR